MEQVSAFVADRHFSYHPIIALFLFTFPNCQFNREGAKMQSMYELITPSLPHCLEV
jgi:hypothetical protein